MGMYGESAIRAVKLAAGMNIPDPQAAWDQAIRSLTGNALLIKKGCPRTTFLGLCEEGLVRGIPRGTYTSSATNKALAIKAVAALRNEPSIDNAVALWHRVTADRGLEDNQMDVVLSLWKNGDIAGRLSVPVREGTAEPGSVQE